MRSPNRSAVLKVYRKSFQEKWEYLRTELLPRKPETEPPPRGPFPPAHLFPSPENQDIVAVTLKRQTCSPKSTTQISPHRRNRPDGTSRPHGEPMLSHRTPPLSSLRTQLIPGKAPLASCCDSLAYYGCIEGAPPLARWDSVGLKTKVISKVK